MVMEKIFTYKQSDWLEYDIYKNNVFYVKIVNSKGNAKRLCEELNRVYEENESLKKELLEYKKRG